MSRCHIVLFGETFVDDIADLKATYSALWREVERELPTLDQAGVGNVVQMIVNTCTYCQNGTRSCLCMRDE